MLALVAVPLTRVIGAPKSTPSTRNCTEPVGVRSAGSVRAHGPGEGDRVAELRRVLARLHRGRRVERQDLGRRLGSRRRCLDIADVVGGDAVEAVGVTIIARERGRGLRGVGLPERVRSAVFRVVDVVEREARAAGVVLARPGHGKAGCRLGGRQRADAAGGRDRVDGDEGLLGRVDSLAWVFIVHLIGGDGLVEVERHQGDVADLGAGRQSGVGADGETDEAGATAGAVFGWQEAGQEVRGRQVRGGIDRLEGGREDPRGRVQVEADDHLERLTVLGHIHSGVVVLQAGRDGDVAAAESDGRELECAPVEVRIEWVADLDPLRRGGRSGVVLEVDLVGEQARVGDISCLARIRRGRPWSWGRWMGLHRQHGLDRAERGGWEGRRDGQSQGQAAPGADCDPSTEPPVRLRICAVQSRRVPAQPATRSRAISMQMRQFRISHESAHHSRSNPRPSEGPSDNRFMPLVAFEITFEFDSVNTFGIESLMLSIIVGAVVSPVGRSCQSRCCQHI